VLDLCCAFSSEDVFALAKQVWRNCEEQDLCLLQEYAYSMNLFHLFVVHCHLYFECEQVANTLDASTMFRRNNMSLRLLKALFLPTRARYFHNCLLPV
jgi:hypothetical protein